MLARASCTAEDTAQAGRVLVVSSTFPRDDDDATPRFVRDLSALATPAWDVTVLAPHHPNARLHERMGPLDVRRFRYFWPSSQERLCCAGGILPNARASWLARVQVPLLALAESAALRRLTRETRFDVVHAHFLLPQGVLAAHALDRRTPLVVSVHGSDLFALPRADALRRRAIARAQIVTVNSATTERELVRRFPEAAPKVRMLPMGIDASLFHAESAVRAPASSPMIAFVGRLSRQKGAHVLADAFARLARRDARLVVAGEGPEPAPGETLGPLAHAGVADLLRRATLLVVPSLGVEAQGLVAIEAMASGCPVVATRSGALADLVGDDVRGLAVSPGDAAALATAIARCLDDPSATRRRAEAARAFVLERYAWPRIQPALLRIYDEARAWA